MSNEIDNLRNEVMQCTKCPELVKSRNKICFSYGSGENGLMMIAEAPSQWGGNITGRPLADNKSRTGMIVQEMLDANNMLNEECYSSNICYCSPPSNRKPLPTEIQNCIPYTRREIEIIQPKLIILFGATARSVFIPAGWKINSIQRRNELTLCYMYHPAYIYKLGNKAKIDYIEAFSRVLDEASITCIKTSEPSSEEQLRMI